MNRNIPYTASDLRFIADEIDKVEHAIGGDELGDGDWRWGVSVSIHDDDGSVTGTLRPHGDGWLGFYPLAVHQRDNKLFGGSE